MSEEKIRKLKELLESAWQRGMKREDIEAIGKMICEQAMFGDVLTIVNTDNGQIVEVYA